MRRIYRHIARGGVHGGIRQAGRIGIVRAGKPELLCRRIHHLHEGPLRARHRLRERHRRVVAGVDQQPVQQLIDGNLLARRNEHPRTAGAPGRHADRHRLVQLQRAVRDRLVGQVGCHQLGETGRRPPQRSGLLGQDRTGARVHQHIGRLVRQRRRGRHARKRQRSGRGRPRGEPGGRGSGERWRRGRYRGQSRAAGHREGEQQRAERAKARLGHRVGTPNRNGGREVIPLSARGVPSAGGGGGAPLAGFVHDPSSVATETGDRDDPRRAHRKDPRHQARQ